MRVREPRIAPLAEQDWSEEQRELLAVVTRGKPAANVFATLVRHPKLFKRWTPFGGHLLFASSLAPRQRELLILRAAWLTRAEYEWGQHVEIAKRAGLGADEIERVAAGPAAAGWTEEEALLLRAADELWEEACLSEESWAALSRRLSETQLMDLVFTVGAYAMLAMALNSFGVQRESGLEGFPERSG
ncbi:MAG TPA: carboxymuconolactone decarboxylase family protein [Stellaceae bacterium]|nr:carboxymuconolactone decarboxylase family protein [Stellaceae bacterium]